MSHADILAALRAPARSAVVPGPRSCFRWPRPCSTQSAAGRAARGELGTRAGPLPGGASRSRPPDLRAPSAWPATFARSASTPRDPIGAHGSAMQITVRQAASYFGVDEDTVRRWIAERDLPVHRVIGADAPERDRGLGVGGRARRSRLAQPARRGPPRARRGAAAVRRCSRRAACTATSRAATRARRWPNIVKRHPDCRPTSIASTCWRCSRRARRWARPGSATGIAIPHVRNPILLHVGRPQVSLFLLRHPVDFDVGRRTAGARDLPGDQLDRSPCTCASWRSSGFALRDPALRELLQRHAPTDEILARDPRAGAAARPLAPPGVTARDALRARAGAGPARRDRERPALARFEARRRRLRMLARGGLRGRAARPRCACCSRRRPGRWRARSSRPGRELPFAIDALSAWFLLAGAAPWARPPRRTASPTWRRERDAPPGAVLAPAGRAAARRAWRAS